MVSPAKICEQVRISRHLVSRDMDIYGAWPMKFGLFSRRRSRWMLFFYLLFTVHTFPSVFLFRLQTFFYDCGFPPIATTISRINHIVFGVTIGNHVRTSGGLIIAHGHVVLDGWTRLGDNVKIGANAVVVDDIPANHTAVGAPARSFPTQKAGNKFEEGPQLPGEDA